MSEDSKVRLYVGFNEEDEEGLSSPVGEWVEFRGRKVAEYIVNDTQSYTVYSCKTRSSDSTQYRLYMVDEMNMDFPNYSLLPCGGDGYNRTYDRAFDLDELLGYYPIFEPQLGSASTRSIDPE